MSMVLLTIPLPADFLPHWLAGRQLTLWSHALDSFVGGLYRMQRQGPQWDRAIYREMFDEALTTLMEQDVRNAHVDFSSMMELIRLQLYWPLKLALDPLAQDHVVDHTRLDRRHCRYPMLWIALKPMDVSESHDDPQPHRARCASALGG